MPLLEAAGISCVAPELPLTNHTDDVAVVRAVVDEIDGPVVLLGHSYGGAVITEAGNHDSVMHLIYLAALGPDEGEPVAGGPVEIGEAFLQSIRPQGAGKILVDPARAIEIFYPDAPAEVAAGLAARLRAGATGAPGETIERAAWRHAPSDYIVCDADPIVLPNSQRALAARMGATVHELPGDHSPFAARPAELTALLVDIITGG